MPKRKGGGVETEQAAGKKQMRLKLQASRCQSRPVSKSSRISTADVCRQVHLEVAYTHLSIVPIVSPVNVNYQREPDAGAEAEAQRGAHLGQCLLVLRSWGLYYHPYLVNPCWCHDFNMLFPTTHMQNAILLVSQ